MSPQFHKELAIMFDDPFERAEEERLELEREELRQCEIRKARIALSMLQPLQRERLMKNVCCGMSSRAIARQEGVFIVFFVVGKEKTMPKTRGESIIFTAITAWMMVYIMTLYNTVLAYFVSV